MVLAHVRVMYSDVVIDIFKVLYSVSLVSPYVLSSTSDDTSI
jgi:hypothetical protein